MKVFLKKKLGSFIPADEDAQEAIKKIKNGEVVRVELRRPRSHAQHNLAMAVLKLAFDNQEKYERFEDLMVEVKLKCGHYKEHLTTKGKIIYVPKSIAFESMKQDDFNVFFERMVDVILKHFLPGVDEDDFRAEVLAMVAD